MANFTIEKQMQQLFLRVPVRMFTMVKPLQLVEGSYTIQLPGQTTSTNVTAANLAFVTGAPTNAGTYSIALSDVLIRSNYKTFMAITTI